MTALQKHVEAMTERVAALEADTKYDDLGQSVRWLHARIDGIENGSIPIAPPEPASQKDDLPPICSNSTCPNYGSSCFEACPDWPEAPSPASLDALKELAAGFTPTEREHLRLCALLDEIYALDRAEQPQGETAEDVKDRAFAVGRSVRDVFGKELSAREMNLIHDAVTALASAGLLASQHQMVTDKASEYRSRLAGLKWSVCESEVLRDPAVKGAARDILTELANLVIEGA